VIRFLVSQVKDYEVAAPRLSDGFHPLQAVYTQSCLPRLYRCLTGGRLSLIDFLQEGQARIVTSEELKPVDPENLSFLNINTPEDLKKAQAQLRAGCRGTYREDI
jgi:molybdopterin-guanine dinucleotide biosynthesis protein A